MDRPDVDGAEQLLAAHAGVLDWRRFERDFCVGGATPVRDAVAAYRNPDGGFGLVQLAGVVAARRAGMARLGDGGRPRRPPRERTVAFGEHVTA